MEDTAMINASIIDITEEEPIKKSKKKQFKEKLFQAQKFGIKLPFY